MPVYMIRAGEHGPVKIGHATDVAGRLYDLQSGNHERLTVLRVFDGGAAEEARLHERFADLHLHGEWHSFSKAMLGDVGLVELPHMSGKALAAFNRMESLSARLVEIGPACFRAELTEEDRAMLQQVSRAMKALPPAEVAA